MSEINLGSLLLNGLLLAVKPCECGAPMNFDGNYSGDCNECGGTGGTPTTISGEDLKNELISAIMPTLIEKLESQLFGCKAVHPHQAQGEAK